MADATGSAIGSAAAAVNRLRWALLPCITYALFANHWSRDSIGALEVPLETEFDLSPSQYNALTSVFFAPNVIMPCVAMALAQLTKVTWTYALFVLILALGNALVGLAVFGNSNTYTAMLAGRALMGVAYEAVDMLPIGLLMPRFKELWGTIVGIVNGFNRLGSVCNFLIGPRLYEGSGLRTAVAVPSAIGASVALTTAFLTLPLDARVARLEAVRDGSATATAPSSSTSSSSTAATSTPAGAERASPAALLGRAAQLLRLARREMHLSFGCYLLGAACVYGAVVPFWFVGAKHISLRFDRSLAEARRRALSLGGSARCADDSGRFFGQADAFILFPEGLILLVAPPFGVYIDRRRWGFVKQMRAAALACLLMAASLACLAWTRLPPLLSVVGLGLGYGGGHSSHLAARRGGRINRRLPRAPGMLSLRTWCGPGSRARHPPPSSTFASASSARLSTCCRPSCRPPSCKRPTRAARAAAGT
jgi:hypothetical protein